MKTSSSYSAPVSPNTLRLIAAALFVGILLVAVYSLYVYVHDLLPLYGRLLRNAPVVETPYLAFTLLMAPPAVAILLLGCAHSIRTGRKFDPPVGSRLHRFQTRMFSWSVKALIYVVPAVMLATTLTLFAKGYSPCSKLLISGSAWQLFWVNDERVCFKPDHYVNDNWPCKLVEGKSVCVQVDGR